MNTLTNRHRAELHASGIADEMIEAAGIRSVNGEIRQILGWLPKGWNTWGEGYAIPFRDLGGADTGYVRVKPDRPRIGDGGKPVKYETALRQPNRAYFPPGVAALLAEARDIVLTEGEKKCLKAVQEGIPAIGLVGVWGWQLKRMRSDTGRAFGPRKLIPDLAGIEWKGKRVFIAFDSDVREKPDVQLAEARLAECLEEQGAEVLVVRLPAGPVKVGLDDYLLDHTADDFRELMNQAKPAEKPDAPASMDWARMYLQDQFTTREGVTLRWWRDEFHVWDGRRYRVIPGAEMKALLIQWLDRRTKVTPKLAGDVLVCLGSEVRVAFETEQPALLDEGGATNPDWIVLENGILPLNQFIRDGAAKLIPHTPRLFTPTAMPFPFYPEAECPVWLQTLNEIFDGDEECFQLLAEWFGCNLTDDTSYQSIMLFEGPPRSGKGTVLRALRQTVGADNCVSPRFATMGDTFGLMGLVGKRVALCPDAHLGHGDKALGVMELLKLISGEDAVEVHRKNLPPVTTRLRIKFTLAVNELPKFGDNAGAIASRLLILPFRNSFLGKEDRKLEEKLAGEAEGILAWAMWGLRRLRENGRFTTPDVSSEIARDFERLSSPVKAFIADRCTVGPEERTTKDALWQAWIEWCKDAGRESGSREKFGASLRSIAGVRRSQPRDGSGGILDCYAGIGLKV